MSASAGFSAGPDSVRRRAIAWVKRKSMLLRTSGGRSTGPAVRRSPRWTRRFARTRSVGHRFTTRDATRATNSGILHQAMFFGSWRDHRTLRAVSSTLRRVARPLVRPVGMGRVARRAARLSNTSRSPRQGHSEGTQAAHPKRFAQPPCLGRAAGMERSHGRSRLRFPRGADRRQRTGCRTTRRDSLGFCGTGHDEVRG